MPITRNHAIFSDIDLSLLPSASTDIEPWQQDLVRSLERKLSGAFAMITGRGIASVDKVFPGIAASVEQHAAWRPSRGASLAALAPMVDVDEMVREALKTLDGRVALVKEICDLARTKNGIHVERKSFSLALVFTHAFDAATKQAAMETAQDILQKLPGLKDTHAIKIGSDSVEIGPLGADKGVAMRDFMAVAPFKGRIPIYIGDGPTDEDAMRVVRQMGGFNLAVGPLIKDESLIDKRVDTIEQVWDILQRWDSKLALS